MSKLNCDIIKKVYVINLERCINRKEHIINEFKNSGINNYEFIKAVDKDSSKVLEIMNSNFIYKFSSCFRCFKKRSCLCKNNILINTQIGNWCSFMYVMNKIIEDNIDDGLTMICEDDIKFKENGIKTMNNMINIKYLKRYNINFNKPIIIRCSNALESNDNLDNIKVINNCFEKKIYMSNPCFIINKEFAEIFKNNLKQIKMTSDMFIHKELIKIDKTIQHLSFKNSPIYELSFNKDTAIFSSEIMNRNNKKLDKHQNIIKKYFIDYLVIGHPRCGTKSMSSYLNQMNILTYHETFNKSNIKNENKLLGISSWLLAVKDIEYPYGNIKRNELYVDNIIHIVRNPFDAIPSIILEHKYTPNNLSYKFKKKHIKNILNIELPDINNFNNLDFILEIEIALKTYLYWNKICELNNPNYITQIENISDLNNKININKNKINLEIKNSNKSYNGQKYIKPVINKEIYYKLNINLLDELKEFCKKYNYNYIL